MKNNNISTYLENLRTTDLEAYNALTASFKEGTAKKGQMLLPIGSFSEKLYFVKSGILKQFRYDNKGSEKIIWFYFDHDLACSVTSMMRQIPSPDGLSVLEDCSYNYLERDQCLELVDKYHAIETYFREIAADYLIQTDERLYLLLNTTTKEKYEYLFKHHPKFIQNISDRQLAMFLGISRETLSRIKNP